MAETIPHIVNRFVINSERTFDDLRQNYESLVPTVDFAELVEVIATGDLSQVEKYTAEHAPHSFVNFWTLDPMPMMRIAGNQQRAITYLMGNKVIAETMFRHDPGIILYAPLRTAIYEDTQGRAHFSVDQPSSKFASFGDTRIAGVGAQLDAKVARLLQLMSLPVPPEIIAP